MVARFEPRRRPVTWERVCLSRLAHQHLLQRRPARALLDVARDLCGLHAQVRSSAELAAAVRVDGLARSAVSRALWTDRTLVKTWAMRGTLHLLPADEYALWVAAQSTRDHFLEPARLRPHGLTSDDVLGVIDAVGTALDGRQLSREELAGEVARLRRDPRLGEMLLSGWGGLLKPAAFRGLLCFGPSRGTKVSFVRPDQWLAGSAAGAPHESTLGPAEALRVIARRFLDAYGPATHDELALWWGFSPRRAKDLLASMPDLVPLELDGSTVWSTPGAVRRRPRRPEAGPIVRLLPVFDPFTVTTRRAGSRPMAVEHKPLVYRAAGWVSAVITVDGEVVGTWSHELHGGRLTVRTTPFDTLARSVVGGIEAEVARLGEHVDAAATSVVAA